MIHVIQYIIQNVFFLIGEIYENKSLLCFECKKKKMAFDTLIPFAEKKQLEIINNYYNQNQNKNLNKTQGNEEIILLQSILNKDKKLEKNEEEIKNQALKQQLNILMCQQLQQQNYNNDNTINNFNMNNQQINNLLNFISSNNQQPITNTLISNALTNPMQFPNNQIINNPFYNFVCFF